MSGGMGGGGMMMGNGMNMADPEMGGDPHIKTWGGSWFDYHGECDLVLLHVPEFDGGSPLSIHVRTTIR